MKATDISKSVAADQADLSLHHEQLDASRAAALKALRVHGMPHRKLEDWRYTNVEAPLKALAAGELDKPDAPHASHECSGADICFVDGKLLCVNANTSAATIMPLAQAINSGVLQAEQLLSQNEAAAKDGFASLNTALFEDGWFINVPADEVSSLSIEYRFTGGDVSTHPRNVLLVGNGAKATIVERYVSEDIAQRLCNSFTKVVVEDNATAEHVRLTNIRGSWTIGTLEAEIRRNASYDFHHLVIGGRLVRTDARAVLAGEGGSVRFNGIHLADGKAHVDTHTWITHQAAHCQSREHYRAIAAGRARSVFDGMIIVAKDAQKTDSEQYSKGLLLSKNAEINAKPELEIYADDVVCAHGATVGALDEEAKFYLKSRGLSDASAQRLLTEAFLGEVLDELPEMGGVTEELVADAQATLQRLFEA